MISLDTNVLARAVLNDDKIQSPIAREKIRKVLKKEEILIPSFAVLELVWLMKVKKKPKELILSVLATIMNTVGFVVANDNVVRHAIEIYKSGKADFGDYLILSESRQNACSKVLTFDQKFSKESGAELVK